MREIELPKTPAWFANSPAYVCHPANTLRDAAKALRLDAKLTRKYGERDVARIQDAIAARLERVADGMSWRNAFDWPKKQTCNDPEQ